MITNKIDKSEKIRKIGGIIITICFFVPVFIIGAYALFDVNPVFSELENRELASAPELVTESGFNRAYYAGLEKHYSDTFPFREKLLTVNRSLKSFYTISVFSTDDDISFVTVDNSNRQPLQSADAPEPGITAPAAAPEPDLPVYAAAEPSGDEDPAPEPEELLPPEPPATQEEYSAFVQMPIVGNRTFEVFDYDESRTRQYIEIVDSIAERCGVPAYVILPPSASELYFPPKYKNPQNDQKAVLEMISNEFKNAELIELYDEFIAAKDEYIYFRTDHHWTADGAYIAYKKFGEIAGFNPAALENMEQGRRDGFLGSLYRTVSQSSLSDALKNEPDYVLYYEPLFDTTVTSYKSSKMTYGNKRKLHYPDYNSTTNLYCIFFGDDLPLMHMKSSVANGKSIMVVRDSYGHAFLGFLANNYENVFAVEPRYFNSFPLAGFIKEHDIDELLFINYSLTSTGKYWLSWPSELKKLN